MNELVQAIAVTAELTGARLSEGAAIVLAEDLATYPLPDVLIALGRCRRELKSRLTPAEVISRINDGRPGVEEAWALLPKDESATAVWTDEMCEAFKVAGPLLDEGDSIGARMAFKETYTRLVAEARDKRVPANWTATLGHDPKGREMVLRDAVETGRLRLETVIGMNLELPAPAQAAPLLGLSNAATTSKQAQAISKLRAIADGAGPSDRLGWARDLEARDKAGQSLTDAQRDAYRAALHGTGSEAATFLPHFAPIPVESLPPAMRADYA